MTNCKHGIEESFCTHCRLDWVTKEQKLVDENLKKLGVSEEEMSNYLSQEKKLSVVEHLKEGEGIRETERQTGVHRDTIMKIKKSITLSEETDVVKKTKTCLKCGAEKELSEFTVNSQMADGLHNWCRDCKTKDQRDRTAKSKPKINLPQRYPPEIRSDPKILISTIPYKSGEYTFREIVIRYQEYLEKKQEELKTQIENLMVEHNKIGIELTGLTEYLSFSDYQNDTRESFIESYLELLEVEKEEAEEAKNVSEKK